MNSVQVNRWKRYGHDRLYVRGPGALEYGWVDLTTGVTHRAAGVVWPAEVGQTVDRWLAGHGVAPGAVVQAPAAVSKSRTSSGSPSSPAADRTAPARPPHRPRPVDALASPGVERRTWPELGRDLARNRAGSSAMAAAQDRTTWPRRVGRALGFRTADGSWREGAAGERLVGETLGWARLLGWQCLHAVPVGNRGGDIDHVLIGPGGVVTVNTKHHRGQTVKAGRLAVFVGGRQTRYAESSLYEGQRAARLLSAATGRPVEVTPIIVVVGTRRLRGYRSQGVRVMRRSDLIFWLAFRRHRLGRAERRELFEVARRETTWQTTAR